MQMGRWNGSCCLHSDDHDGDDVPMCGAARRDASALISLYPRAIIYCMKHQTTLCPGLVFGGAGLRRFCHPAVKLMSS